MSWFIKFGFGDSCIVVCILVFISFSHLFLPFYTLLLVIVVKYSLSLFSVFFYSLKCSLSFYFLSSLCLRLTSVFLLSLTCHLTLFLYLL